MGYSHRSTYYLVRCAHSHFAKCGIDNRWGGRMQANGAWDKALKPEKLGILSNAETKLDVVNAMADLMETTPLEKLTVSQISKTSGISRSSFYRCFEDKYAVAQWHIQFVHLNGVDQIGRTLSWYEGYFRTEADFVKYKRFYAGATKKSDYNTIDESIPRCRKETLIETIRDYHGKKLTTKLFFEIEALAAMEFKTLPWWHDDAKYPVTLEQKCQWMCELVPRDLFDMLNQPVIR